MLRRWLILLGPMDLVAISLFVASVLVWAMLFGELSR
jgi:hypothetical protein